MTPMMMGIIAAVVIVIIVAVVLMRKKSGGDGGMTTNSNRPKTLAEQQQELQARANTANQAPATVPSSQPTQPSEDVLKTAQNLFDQRDYERAEQVLKPAMAREPNRSDLALLLLNTYAVSKNYDAFNALYPTLQGFNDSQVQTQAANLKSLVDEELAFNAAPPTSAVPSVTASPTVAEPAPTTSNVSDDSLDFDFSLDDEPTISASQPATSTPTPAAAPTAALDDFDFDLALDSLSPASTAPTDAPVSTKPDENVLSSADTELVLPADTAHTRTPDQTLGDELTADDSLWQIDQQAAATDAPAVQTTSTQDKVLSAADTELDLSDVDDFTLDAPVTAAEPSTDVHTPVTTNAATAAADFDDFTLDTPAQQDTNLAATTPALNTSTPVVNAPPVDDIAQFDEIDLTFDEPTAAQATPTLATDTPKIETNEFDFSDLALDVPNAIESPAQTQTLATLDDTATDWTDFELDFEQSDQDKPQTSAPTSADTHETAETPELPTVSSSEVYAPSATQPTVAEPTVTTADDALSPALSDALAHVEQMDRTALTLALAEQYLELGEYDSAKRLLNEIAPHVSGDAKAKIHALLDKTY